MLRVEVVREPVTLDQVERIIRHFGRHAAEVVDVQVDYDYTTQALRLTGEPAAASSPRFAQESLEEAIRAAQALHPADNLDISA